MSVKGSGKVNVITGSKQKGKLVDPPAQEQIKLGKKEEWF
mgnify:CR=1 FL=1